MKEITKDFKAIDLLNQEVLLGKIVLSTDQKSILKKTRSPIITDNALHNSVIHVIKLHI